MSLILFSYYCIFNGAQNNACRYKPIIFHLTQIWFETEPGTVVRARIRKRIIRITRCETRIRSIVQIASRLNGAQNNACRYKPIIFHLIQIWFEAEPGTVGRGRSRKRTIRITRRETRSRPNAQIAPRQNGAQIVLVSCIAQVTVK